MNKIIKTLLIMTALIPALYGSKVIYNPFSIDIDPMERLLLINIENDPDSLYIGFEPQVFADDINGTGHIVIAWRKDGRVDVYHQPSLQLNPDKYNIAGQGLAYMIEREMSDALFEIEERGVQAYYNFPDIHGRTIIIDLTENNTRKRKPFGLLAPMGDAVEKPSTLPLVLLHDFYFVRRKHTDIHVAIGGRKHQPDKMPMLMDWAKMYFIRYSDDPLIATLNTASSGELYPLKAESNQTVIKEDGIELNLTWKEDISSIQSISRKHKHHTLKIEFSPHFPNLSTFNNEGTFTGTFRIEGDPTTGNISGEYNIENLSGETVITLTPSEGWKPVPTKLSLRFLYRAAKIFRRWPATYQWTAVITKTDENRLNMTSTWERINR